MKLKSYILSALLVLNTLAFAFAPRFGWVLRTENPADPYKYQKQRKLDNQIAAIYKSSNSTLEIGYNNRLSGTLKIQLDNNESYIMEVRIDGASDGSPQGNYPVSFDYALSDIIWKDSSGIFYYRYILVIAAMLGYALLFVKAKSKSKPLYIPVGIGLFILSTFISLRIVI